jgi:hypothetical protein
MEHQGRGHRKHGRTKDMKGGEKTAGRKEQISREKVVTH